MPQRSTTHANNATFSAPWLNTPRYNRHKTASQCHNHTSNDSMPFQQANRVLTQHHTIPIDADRTTTVFANTTPLTTTTKPPAGSLIPLHRSHSPVGGRP
ncbi:hypothetical protein Pcinc_019772 [Petrolisthes cinctipes]|uniref:Uncharacterized protein n=1 Tax=Petrolisthes cinctipes TaxID=88211 RepID=A0AAE1FKJ3_PETCI|nr:hypothetical protein Pcinc_019772 [Petrolisthes cinctipes]